MIKIKAKQDTLEVNKQHGPLPMVMTRRLTVNCVEGGGEREIQEETCHCFLCPSFSFLPCLPTQEHHSEVRDADSDMWKLSSIVDALLHFIFFPYLL